MYIQVDETYFNNILRKSLQKPPHHEHIHHPELIKTDPKIMSKEAITHSNNIQNSMNKQVNAVKNWVKSDSGRTSRDNQELSEEDVTYLDNRLNLELKEDKDTFRKTVENAYKKGKDIATSKINRLTVLRNVDEINQKLLKYFNWEYIKRLANDVRQRLYELVSKGFIKADSESSIINGLKDFVKKEKIGLGNFTAKLRADSIANDVIQRSKTGGIIAAYKDYALKYGNSVINSGNPCGDCVDLVLNNPHLLVDLERAIPMHNNCMCSIDNLGGEDISENPISNPGITDTTYMW